MKNRIKKVIEIVKKWIKKLFDFAKPSILKPLSWVISSLVFILLFLLLLNVLLPRFNLYISFRDSIVSLAKSINIEVKKKNNLVLKIGHSDSEKGPQDDNYKVISSNINEDVGVWFMVYNPDSEDTYKKVRLFISFLNEDNKIDGGYKDKNIGIWTKFKNGHFNYGYYNEFAPGIMMQTDSINFKFPHYGEYKFRYAIYADGYRPITGTKTIIIEK